MPALPLDVFSSAYLCMEKVRDIPNIVWKWLLSGKKEMRGGVQGLDVHTAFRLVLSLQSCIWGFPKGFLPLSTLSYKMLSGKIWVSFLKWLFEPRLLEEGIQHIDFFCALGKGTFISNRGNGYINYHNGFLHHWEVCSHYRPLIMASAWYIRNI